MTNYVTEIERKIYVDDAGHCVSVLPSADFPGNVMILTRGKAAEDYFGKIRLDMPAEFMRQLGKALIASADEEEQ